MPKAIEAAAAAIRLELDVLLADYSGDEKLHELDTADPARRALAVARLEAMDWLRATWAQPLGDIVGVAKAALEAAEKVRE